MLTRIFALPSVFFAESKVISFSQLCTPELEEGTGQGHFPLWKACPSPRKGRGGDRERGSSKNEGEEKEKKMIGTLRGRFLRQDKTRRTGLNRTGQDRTNKRETPRKHHRRKKKN